MKRLVLMLALLALGSTELKSGNFLTPRVFEFPAPIPVLSDWDIFVEALIQVESKGDSSAVGTLNDVGIFQITPIYVKDVNRILGEDRYDLACRTNVEKSREMFEIFQNHYNPQKNISKAIKLHNPGAPQSYRIKITEEINNIKNKRS